MKRHVPALLLLLVTALLLTAFPAAVQQKRVLFREDFDSLDNWKDFFFPKIARHSTYTIERHDGSHVLRAESKASASAIVYNRSFNVYEYPRARWKWKVANLYRRGDARTREGDDYPIRVYIMFEYDPARAGILERMQYGLARTLYGEYPPHSSLSYAWASRQEPSKIMTSPYTARAKMVFLEQGPDKVGTWQEETVDILDDYRRAFGADPPPRARIALMNDSDNTGEASVSWMAYVEVFSE